MSGSIKTGKGERGMRKGTNLYVIQAVETEATLNIGRKIELSWIDGMKGALPVFTNKRKAQKYVNTFPKESRPQIKTMVVK